MAPGHSVPIKMLQSCPCPEDLPKELCVEEILKTRRLLSSYLLALLLSLFSPYHLLGPEQTSGFLFSLCPILIH